MLDVRRKKLDIRCNANEIPMADLRGKTQNPRNAQLGISGGAMFTAKCEIWN